MAGMQCLKFKGIKGRLSSQGVVSLVRHWGAMEDKTVTVSGASGQEHRWVFR